VSDVTLAPTAALGAAGANPAATDPHQEVERLRTLAAQFESILLGQMLREMRDSTFDEDKDESGFGGGPLADSLYSELSVALSRAGGLGVGQAMLEPLTRQAGSDRGQTGVRPGSDQGQTRVRPGSDQAQTGVKPGSTSGGGHTPEIR
jgi:Rod binding domain-containing protein